MVLWIGEGWGGLWAASLGRWFLGILGWAWRRLENTDIAGPERWDEVALGFLAGFAPPNCKGLGDPLILPGLKTGRVELCGLGPQIRSHPITFEIIIRTPDLEKIINKTLSV